MQSPINKYQPIDSSLKKLVYKSNKKSQAIENDEHVGHNKFAILMYSVLKKNLLSPSYAQITYVSDILPK